MDCSEFEVELAERLDLRQDLQSSGLRVHAESCASCRRSLVDATLLLKGVAAWRQPLPQFNLLDRVSIVELTQNLERSPTTEKVVVRQADRPVRSSFLAWGLIGTSAAALCFMFGSAAFQQNAPLGQHRLVTLRGDRTGDKSAYHKPVDQIAAPAIDAGPSMAQPDLETVFASAGHAYSHLAQETAAAAQDFALLVPSKTLFTSSELPEPGNSPAPANSNPMFPGNVYPVGDSVENALQFLWKSVPGMDQTTS